MLGSLSISGILSSSLSKIVIVVGLASSLFVLYNHIESKGYERALTEIATATSEAITKRTNEILADAETKLQLALNKQRLLFDAELATAKSQVIVREKIVKQVNEIEKIKYVQGDCTTVKPEFMRLLDNTICTVNRTCQTD